MSKNNAVAQISFHGQDHDQIVSDNPDMRNFVRNEAFKIPYGNIKCYVSPRYDEEPLVWTVSVASPRGRSTFNVVQHAPGSTVYATVE